MVEAGHTQQTLAWGPNFRLPVFINGVLLEHSIAHLFTYCLAAFVLGKFE